jgi:LacI family transcriptional regulator
MLIQEIRQNLEGAGFDCIMSESKTERDGKSTARRLVLQKKVDGFILVLAGMQPEDWVIIHKHDIPIIQVHYRPMYFDSDRLDYFYTDNFAGGKAAADRLIEKAGPRIICLADSSGSPEMKERTNGYRASLKEHGILPDDSLYMETPTSFDSSYRLIRDRIETVRKADGLFAHTDIMAVAVLKALRDEGVSVPKDFKVIGYDDLEIGTWVSPTLTTMHQPRDVQAKLACDRLVYLIQGGKREPLEQRLIPPSLVVRESC